MCAGILINKDLFLKTNFMCYILVDLEFSKTQICPFFFATHYRPQRSCEGYAFTGVCLSRGGREVVSQHALQVVSQHALQQVSSGGAWSGGSALGGVSAPRVGWSGGCLVRGVCSWGRLVSQHAVRQSPLGETATATDGTHATGMHSCFLVNFFIRFI